jgi:hypothetical protein
MQIQGIVGAPQASYAQGSTPPLRQGQLGDLIVSELHGKYYEAAYRGNLFSVGMNNTALSANTISLTATTTPIIGVWNPLSSNVNLVMNKAKCLIVVAGNSAVAPGAFVWATSTGNAGLTLGVAPLSRKTLVGAGSQAKGFNISTALTGLTNNLVVQNTAAFGTLVAAQGATATPMISGDAVEEFDGSLIVPPGGLLCLLNTISTTTINVAAMLMWEEVPV